MANVTASGTDPVLANNCVTVTTTVSPLTDLSISAGVSPDPVTVGSDITYTLTVTNRGPSAANGVTLTSNLPSGVLFISVIPSSGACSSPGNALNCNLGSLASGAVRTVTLVVKSTNAGVISLTANVTGSEADPAPANNTVTQNVTVTPYPVPVLTRVSPDWVTDRVGAFVLRVIGSNLANGAFVRWNGSNRPTVYVSSTELTASIPASDTASTGTDSFNPALANISAGNDSHRQGYVEY
jgi:uncharacterized repeat protein (TIGR01451 family)